jgi:hypothetical protein
MLGVGRSLKESAANAQQKVDETLAWGRENGVEFAPTKTEVINFSRRYERGQQPTVLNGNSGISEKTALRWFGNWFDRKLAFKRHIEEKAAAAARFAAHIKGLSKVHSDTPPGAVTKAIRTIMIPKALLIWL